MLDVIDELLRVGGTELLARRGGPRDIERKQSTSDIVTDADLASEEAILERLRDVAPGDGWISEEFGHEPGSTGRMWVIDPLDGTSNYSTGLDDFGVIIGLVENDEVTAGGMYLPVDDLSYLAAAGGGATRNGHPIHVSSASEIDEAFIDHSLANRSEILTEQDRTLGLLIRNARGVRCNHSLRYLAQVAEGILDGFVYHSLGLWDLVGSSAVLAEAGARVTAIDGSSLDLRPRAEAMGTVFQVIGANPALHTKVVDLLA